LQSTVGSNTQTGRYRCHWAQHRARRKAEGELQAPRQEIANADTGEIFEVKKRGVADQIEATTGMDFDRFTRSMMLAQGGFAAFLQAAPDERGPILEQITGTEIYSEISIRVHERHREEQEALQLLKAEVAGIEPLEVEEEKSHREQLETQEKQVKATGAEVSQVADAIAWLTGMNTLEKEIAGLKTQEESLQTEIVAFTPKRDQLADAQRAVALDGDYATLTSQRKQQAQDETALEDQEKALPELEESVGECKQTHETAEKRLSEAKAARKKAEPLIREVLSLDQSISDESRRVTSAREQCDGEEKGIASLRDKQRLEKQKLASEAGNRKRVDSQLGEHAQDEWLISGFTGVEANLAALATKRDDITRKEKGKVSAATALQKAQETFNLHCEQCANAERKHAGATQQVSQAQLDLAQLLDGRLLREYRKDKETLLREMNLLKQIAELEDHRAHLEDGKPCPLCGAPDHPYAVGNVPSPDETEQQVVALASLITQAEDKEEAIKQLQTAEQAARDNLQAANNEKAQADSQKAAASHRLDTAVNALESSRREFDAQNQSVEEQLRPLGISTLAGEEIDAVIEQLRERRDAWQAAVDERDSIERKSVAIQAEIQRLEALIGSQGNALANNLGLLRKGKEALDRHRQQRAKLFGDKNPDDEMEALDESVNSAEASEQAARSERTRIGENLAAANTRIESLRQRIDKRAPEFAGSEDQFRVALSAAEFSSEAQFLEVRLSSEQRTSLATAAQALDNRHTQLQARISDRQAQLSGEEKRHVTDKRLVELQSLRDALQRQYQEILSAVGSLKHALQKNDEAKELLSVKQAAIDAQALDFRRWGNLHALIGSSDGKKYRNFAQGLTFEMMVGHANRQLQKMSDRYLLVRDPAQPLELNVLDNYQAGEMRSTKNLSGGESFIVSLSLALGLSQMASRNVRVDSLFLDEGFGTLDEEALDTALETLSGLQQEGKLIGVISHVQALKERISTQIQVAPQAGGRSQISGPGCALAQAPE